MTKETSKEVATKASRLMRDGDDIIRVVSAYVAESQSVAASALAQREPDQPCTSCPLCRMRNRK